MCGRSISSSFVFPVVSFSYTVVCLLVAIVVRGGGMFGIWAAVGGGSPVGLLSLMADVTVGLNQASLLRRWNRAGVGGLGQGCSRVGCCVLGVFLALQENASAL